MDLTLKLVPLILRPSSKEGDIKLYSSAKGTRITKYYIGLGEEQRDQELNAARGYSDDAFRAPKVDLQILPQKLVDLLIIATHPFNGLNHCNPKTATNVLNNLISLASMDYSMRRAETTQLKKSTHEIYESLSSRLGPDEQEEAEILGYQDEW